MNFKKGRALTGLLLTTLPIICLLFIFANKESQTYELEADRLATELVGKEAYVRALEKIHEMNLIPRQFNQNGKETLSHPSLEARIKAVDVKNNVEA